eukprot:6936024-Pyramimonas_sp.AAC.1
MVWRGAGPGVRRVVAGHLLSGHPSRRDPAGRGGARAGRLRGANCLAGVNSIPPLAEWAMRGHSPKMRVPIAEGEREYIPSGYQSQKGRENIPLQIRLTT